jgi:hypothetical protein
MEKKTVCYKYQMPGKRGFIKTLKHSFSKDFSDGEAKIYERQASYFLRKTTHYIRR